MSGVIETLLSSGEPSIRFKVLVNVLGRGVTSCKEHTNMAYRGGYEKAAHLYDLFDRKENIEFFYRYASAAGEILDIGAGTGRIAIPLAEQGVRVFCIEPSPAMRREFERKLTGRPDLSGNIHLAAGDAGTFDLGRTFPAAFLVFETYESGALMERIEERSQVGIVHREGLHGLLGEAGFAVRREFGDYDLSDYREGGTLLIVEAVKEGNTAGRPHGR